MPTYTDHELHERKAALDAITKILHDHAKPLETILHDLEVPHLDTNELTEATRKEILAQLHDLTADAAALKKLELSMTADFKKALDQLK